MIRETAILCVVVMLTGCESGNGRNGRAIEMEITAYCSCEHCCSWTRDAKGRPVYAYGKSAGKPKEIGRCADGTMAAHGTIAADTRYYPFGTRMYIPGYGNGTVHDRGGSIKGPNRIDIYFETHKEALVWGRQHVVVTLFPIPVTIAASRP